MSLETSSVMDIPFHLGVKIMYLRIMKYTT